MTVRPALCLLAAALALAGCRSRAEGPPPDRRLLGRMEGTAEPGARPVRSVGSAGGQVRVALDRPTRVEVGESDREAVVTGTGFAWSAPLPEGEGGTLELALAALGAPAGKRSARARAELVGRDGKRRVLLDEEVRPGELWGQRRFPLPAPEDGTRLALSSAGALPVAWSEVFLVREGEAQRPDLVLILVDTLRADHLSSYGYPRPTSPNFDRLAAEGTLFQRSISAATWTLPSTASLLTGLLPDQHGARHYPDTLPAEAVTLAEELRELGYRTAAFTEGGFVDPQWGLAQGFDRYDTTRRKGFGRQRVPEVARDALSWLEGNAFSPYFLLVHTYEPHQPYANRAGFADPFLPPGERGPDVMVVRLEPGARFEERELTHAVALYDGEIRRADHYLGKVLDALRPRAGRTAVLLTSDHGEEFQEHGGLEHFQGKLFEENVRVPLLLKVPRGPAGRRVEETVTGLDVAPTLLELAGAPERALPGRSLLKVAGERHIVIQGLNSPAMGEVTSYRLDRGPASLLLDRLQGSLSAYDRGNDPEMRRPRPAEGEATERFQVTLAALSGGPLAVRLPREASGVAVPAGSRVVPLGLWDGLAWRAGEGPLPATPGLPHCLVFRPGQGSGSFELSLSYRGGGTRMVRLSIARGRSDRAWNPLEDDLPPPLAAFAAAPTLEPGRARPAAEDLEELRALGYVR